MCSICTLKRQRYLTLMHVLLHIVVQNFPHKNRANVICLVFVWMVLGAFHNNACKQNKVSAIASLMCKLYKLCHLPAFCVESSICSLNLPIFLSSHSILAFRRAFNTSRPGSMPEKT